MEERMVRPLNSNSMGWETLTAIIFIFITPLNHFSEALPIGSLERPQGKNMSAREM
ncbi:MAG: hypothetical protein V3R56_04360 [Xanthomonadales bacterium]